LLLKNLEQPAYNADKAPIEYLPSPALNQNLSGHKFKKDQNVETKLWHDVSQHSQGQIPTGKRKVRPTLCLNSGKKCVEKW